MVTPRNCKIWYGSSSYKPEKRLPREGGRAMEKLEWNDNLKIGFSEIDQHHKHLFGLFKQAHDDFKNGAPNLEPIFNELIDYTRYHFKSEEVWMIDKFYPEVHKHISEHDSFLISIKEKQESFKSGQEYMSIETLLFLRAWIVDHILNTDTEFGKFIKESGCYR
jgi:hemerythrin